MQTLSYIIDPYEWNFAKPTKIPQSNLIAGCPFTTSLNP